MSLVFLLMLGALAVHCNEIDINHINHESGDSWTEIFHQPTVEGNRFYGISHQTLSTGHDISLDYDFEVKENTVFLDDVDGIFPYSCSNNVFVVKLQYDELQDLFVVGGFLIGKIGNWDCIGDNGKQRSVLQKILSIYYDSNTQLLSMHVTWISHLDVVQPNCKFSIKILPGNIDTLPDSTSGNLELHHAPEVPSIYVGKSNSTIQKRATSPSIPGDLDNANFQFNVVLPSSVCTVSCPNCNFQVSIGIYYVWISNHLIIPQSVSVGVYLSIKGSFVFNLNAPTVGAGSYTILEKDNGQFETITVLFGGLPIQIDPYTEIESNYKWTVASSFNGGFTIPYQTLTRGIQYNDKTRVTSAYDSQNRFYQRMQWKVTSANINGNGFANTEMTLKFGLDFPGSVDFFTSFPIAMTLSSNIVSQCLEMDVTWKISVITSIGLLKFGGKPVFQNQVFQSVLASKQLDSMECKLCDLCVPASKVTKKRMILQDDDDYDYDYSSIPYYTTSNWTDCSNACAPQGELTYATVTCNIGSQVLPPIYCGGIDPPPSVAFCDASQCTDCSEFRDCESCIASPCYWCPTSKMCNDTCTNPEDNGGQYYHCIDPNEVPIKITSCDTQGPFPWTVNWTGGYIDSYGNIGGAYIYVIDSNNNVWSQFGVPESISSNQNIIWQPNGIAAGNYIFILESSTENYNYDSCNVTVAAQKGSTTVVTSWTPCSETCGGGYQSRNVSCFNNGVFISGSPCIVDTSTSFLTYRSCNVFPCFAGSLILTSPDNGAVFFPNSSINISWAGGTLGALLSLDLLLSYPNIPLITQYAHIDYFYNSPPFTWNGIISLNLQSGDYLLSLSVVTMSLEGTGISDDVAIHISSYGNYVFDIIVNNLNPVTVTLYGSINTNHYTLQPYNTSSIISIETDNIGIVYQASTASSNLVAMSVSTDQASKAIFGFLVGQNSSDCSVLMACDICLMINTCGWCDISQLCLPKGSSGPSIGDCKSNWFSSAKDCHCDNSGHIIAIHCVALLGMILLQLILIQ